MITRIEIDGFKSLRDFAMDLEPFTVLIGPNSAGKSNILEALALLSRLVSMSMNDALKLGRGRVRDQFSRRGSEVVGEMTFKVDLLVVGARFHAAVPRAHSRWRYVLRLSRRAVARLEQIVIAEESLSAILTGEDDWASSHPEMAPWLSYKYSQPHAIFERRRNESTGDLELTIQAGSSRGNPSFKDTVVALGDLFIDEEELIAMELQSLGFFSPDSIQVSETSESTDVYELARDGSNLPTVLASLDDEAAGSIRADLAALIPSVASFEVTKDEEENVRLDLLLSTGERLPARLASGGTLRILALLTVLRMSPRSTVLCLEEPENGIYPARLRALLERLRQASSTHESEERYLARAPLGSKIMPGFFWNLIGTQTLLTTHSPVALAALRAEPRHLRFIDMVVRDSWRVSRARGVGQKVSRAEASQMVSVREIDRLLQAAQSGEEGA